MHIHHRGLSVPSYSVGHLSNSIPPSAIYVITFSLVMSTLMAASIVEKTENLDRNKNLTDKPPPFDFPETSTQNLATASPEQIRKITSHSEVVQSEAEDMMNSKANKTDAVVDRDKDAKDSSLEKNESSNATISQRIGETNSTLDTNTNATATMDENSESTSSSTTITETTTLLATTTTPVVTTITTIATTTPQIVTSTIIPTTTPPTTTTTTMTTTIPTTQVQITDTPKTESPTETSTSTEENGKMPSGVIVLVTMITFAAVAVLGYVSLIVWRRYLEFRYGNRELLVNDLEFDTNDLRHFEL